MTIEHNLQIIGERIRIAEQRYQRPAHSVQLLAVSKFHPTDAIVQAHQAGQLLFGENYVQEMQDKAQALNTLKPAIDWHFIGPLQSNKTRIVAETAHWVHAIERFKIAERLSVQRPPHLPALNLCLQINISHEASKSGIELAQASELAHQITELKGVKLRGLMAIPAPETDVTKQRQAFAQLRQCLDDLNAQGLQLDTLSMGMSDDMEAAIAEGATIVRIGTAIFGQRVKS